MTREELSEKYWKLKSEAQAASGQGLTHAATRLFREAADVLNELIIREERLEPKRKET